jgi:ionotropic glutamate receptor NMDA 2B
LHQLAYPTTVKPPFRFGTIPFGSTEATLQKFYPTMYNHMKKYNKTVVKEGIEAVHNG